jgi:3-deoxy-7-phosphoheptulonate synthase
MIIVMERNATQEDVDRVVERIRVLGYRAHVSQGEEATIVGVVGHSSPSDLETLEMLSGVERMMPVLKPYKLGSRDFTPQNTMVEVNGVTFGGHEIVIIAGPCAVESEEQLWEAACAVKDAGGKVLRAGAFKPRTSPYSFQGMGRPALELLADVRRKLGLVVVTEVLSLDDVDLVASHVDILQIGARNMQNFTLLQEVGRSGHPVLLKRGMSATIEEFLMSAEYILANHNNRILLCERGIRTF